MYIYISTTGKAENSLKALDLSGVNRYDCMLKTPSSIERPEVILSQFIPGAKYAWIPAFKRYYFIEDIIAIHNERFSYTLSVDVLGSYSTEIKAKSLYCSRSSAGSAMLPDPFITHKNVIQLTSAIGTWEAGTDFTGGIFALETVSGGTSSGQGSTSVFLVSGATLQSLMSEIFNASSAIYGSDITDDSVKTYFNPFQYIISCKWFPFNPGSGNDPITFGFWTSSYSGIKVGADFGFTRSASVTIPKPNGDCFQSYSPEWCRHEVFVPGFGQLPIDSKYSGKTLTAFIAVDYSTGNANLELIIDGKMIGTAAGQWGIPVQLSQLSVDVSNIGSTLVGGLESMTGNVFGNAISGQSGENASFLARLIGVGANFARNIPIVGNLIAGGREVMAPTLSTCGTNGNRCYMYEEHGFFVITRYFVPDNATDVHSKFNYPDDKVRTLSGLSGYAVFNTEQSVNVGNSTENSLINAFLEGGVYIE